MPLRALDPVVLGLPRGGVPVAFEVARMLGAPLDVIVVRKLGVPTQPELGMGAIGEDDVRVLNPGVVAATGVSARDIADVEARERTELQRRARRFRGDRPMVALTGRAAIIVDDGLATGGTARAAVQVARAHGAGRVVLAVPVAPADTVRSLAEDADEVVALRTPDNFYAIGQWYGDFTQTTDEQVVELLDRAREGSDPPGARDEEVEIAADGVGLAGHLTVPLRAAGVVVFAHGSGSSRHSPRNRAVARAFDQHGLGTLLFDLLTDDEALDRANVFDVTLLGSRLRSATGWLRSQCSLAAMPIGYFGASTGAAAALWAAAEPDAGIAAVVSRGGRPDLAGPRLPSVAAPTLLIVGGNDDVVVELNREAARRLRCEHHLAIVAGATHLFEEPGTLEEVARLAIDWFIRHLGQPETAR